MQISITNGTIASVSETLSPFPESVLPSSIQVSGADYTYISGTITLTNLTSSILIKAVGTAGGKNLVTYDAFKKFKTKLIQAYLGANSGEYDYLTSYVVSDIVYYNNKLYVCKQNCINTLPTDTEYWEILIKYEEPPIESYLATTFAEMLVSSDNYGFVVNSVGNVISEEFVLTNNEVIETSNNEIFYVRS